MIFYEYEKNTHLRLKADEVLANEAIYVWLKLNEKSSNECSKINITKKMKKSTYRKWGSQKYTGDCNSKRL